MVQLSERVLYVLLRPTDGALIGVHIVCEFPITLAAFLGKAISVVRSMYRPGVHGERIVFVNDPDLVTVLLQDIGHQGAMHPGAERTFEVVEIYDRDFRVRVS